MQLRSLFRGMEKFSIYYGRGNVDRLMRYDAVVVEPDHMTSDEVQLLREGGVLILGYISVMEVHEQHPLWDSVSEADFLRYDRPPYEFLIQQEYNNHIVDMRSSRWRGLLLRHAGELLTKKGYDGIFLDTIGDVEMTGIPQQMQQVEAAATFVEQLRKWFPNTIIVQNNGLELLCLQTARYLDGITWENPPIFTPESRAWVKAVSDRLIHLRLTHNLRILILFEGTRQDARADFIRGRSFADECGFTAYFSPSHYQSFHS